MKIGDNVSTYHGEFVDSEMSGIFIINENNDKTSVTVFQRDKLASRIYVQSPKDQNSRPEQKSSEGLPKTITKTIINATTLGDNSGIDFILIPAGSFKMGSSKEWPDTNRVNNFNKYKYESHEGERYGEEKPERIITITKPFYISKYEITQNQWLDLMPVNLSFCRGDNKPVSMVSYEDVQIFIERLNSQENNGFYRLPTEAEWEYAARAGTQSDYSFGNDVSKLSEYAWYGEKYDNYNYLKYSSTTECGHNVGTKKPNAFGLYDMEGNVSEWLSNWYNPLEYYVGSTVDPIGPPYESYRAARGCNVVSIDYECRIDLRHRYPSSKRSIFTGFRLVYIPNEEFDITTYPEPAISFKTSESVFRLMQAKVVDSNGIKNLVTAEEFQTLLDGGIIQITEDQEYIQFFGYNNKIYQESSYATAYLINNDGYLLTNAHAVDLLRIKTVDSLFIILSIEPFKIIPAEIIWSSWQEASSDDMREDTRHDGRMIPYGYSDLAVIRVSPSSLNVPPLKFAKFDFDEIFRYDYDKRTKSTRPLLSRGIGFPASSDIMYGELNNQQLFEKPKISSGEINDLNFVENMTFDHYYYLISTNSSGHGNSGEPIVNMCGEILGTVFSGTELFSFEDLMGNDSFFIPLPYTFEQLDKLKINYDVLNEPCASSDIIEYESIGQRAFQRGLTFYNDKNYTKAVALFAKAIQEDPQYSDALYYRGVSYSFLKEYDNSIQDLNQVIKILPNSANAYYTRGRSFYFNDQYEEAINDITKYLEMEPNDPSGNNLLGWIYYTIGDNEKAVEFATISINLKSDFGAAYDTRGQAYFALGQNEKAIEDALKACEFGECDFRNKLKDLNLL